MSHIKSIGTKPEIIVRKWLKSKNISFQMNNNSILGKPDIVFPKKHISIFIHGCFWHHHRNCKRATLPKTNKKYWLPKIENNVKRDRNTAKRLRSQGWHVLTVWECEIKKDVDKSLNRIVNNYIK